MTRPTSDLVPGEATALSERESRLGNWLPPSRAGRRLVVASLVDSVGTGLFLAGSALFFTRVLDLSSVQVGLGLSLAGLAGLLGIVPIGRVADRIGTKPAIVALYLWRGACFVVYPFVNGPVEFYVLACLAGVGEWGGGPVIQTIVGTVEEADRRVRTMAIIGSVRNIGFTIGAVLATIAMARDDTAAFSALVFADAATFFVAAALLARLPIGRTRKTEAPQLGKAIVRLNDVRFLAVTALNGVLYLHSVLLAVVLPLWIATRTAAPTPVVGAVVVVNTIMAITLQVPLSRGSNDLATAATRLRWAGWCLAGCCVLAAATANATSVAATAFLIVTVAALTLGEIWQSVGAWGVSYALSPEDQRAHYLSVFELGKGAATAVGPALLTWAVMRNGMSGWFALAAFFGVAGLTVALVTSGIGCRQAIAADSPQGEH